ncbi:MAG: siderophore-interacting protein [Beijerinckiaceae bacterium]|nr:siderophore-interacting protein [Beijerinckiaceae bacterium]
MSGQVEPATTRKRRPPPKLVRVEAIERVTPALLRITFGGPELFGFTPPRAAAHIKLFFPPSEMVWPPRDADAPRAPSRTYTPRRFDVQRGLLDVEIVLHGEGLASSWAENAQVGDEMTIGGPGGGYEVPEGTKRLIIMADESALPAAGMILEALRAECKIDVIAEISNRAEERELSPVAPCQPVWLHRSDIDQPGAALGEALNLISSPDENTSWWIACEAAAMRKIRQQVALKFGVPKARLHTRGYWKKGASNHPDHDYGDDAG